MRETAHFFGTGGSVFGIVSHADPAVMKRTGVIILNAGQVHHVGPNRLHVGIARNLAKVGHACVRIDQSGKGESPPHTGMSRQQSLSQDFNDVKAYLKDHGVDRYVLLGLCSGADDGLVISQSGDDVAGLVLLDSYAAHSPLNHMEHAVRDVLDFQWVRHPPRNVLARLKGRWANRHSNVDVREWEAADVMNAYFSDFLKRDGKIMAIFTRGARYYTGRGQLARAVGSDRGLTELYWRNATHTFSEREYRDKLYATLAGWMTDNFS